MALDVIAFDCYGTLVDIRTHERGRDVWRTVSNLMGYHGARVEADALKAEFDAALAEEAQRLLIEKADLRQADDAALEPEPDEARVFGLLYARHGVEADDTLCCQAAQVYRAAATSYLRLYAGAVDMLEAVRSAGVRVVLLSNAQQAYTEMELKALGVYAMFDRVFLSSNAGVRKPSEAFFRQMLSWCGTPSARVMMVGNSPRDDILPARRLGLQTCYVHSAQTAHGVPWPGPDWYVPRPDMRALRGVLLRAMKA